MAAVAMAVRGHRLLTAMPHSQVGATRVDAVHQIEALHGRGLGVGKTDGAGVVDQDVNPAKGFHRQWQRVPAWQWLGQCRARCR
jgi:hypothetical protein